MAPCGSSSRCTPRASSPSTRLSGWPPITRNGRLSSPMYAADQQTLEFTDSGDGPCLMLIVHHDDAGREFANDRNSPVGKLDTAWDEAVQKGWNVVSMKDDSKTIFAFPQ